MAARDTELACSSAIGGQPIGADGLGTDTGVLQQLSEQTHRSFGIATFLDEHVEDFAFVVDSPPEPHPLAPCHRPYRIANQKALSHGTADLRLPLKLSSRRQIQFVAQLEHPRSLFL